jgi:hypothetical protein
MLGRFRTLLEATRLCYRFDPNERPTSSALIQSLDFAIENHMNTLTTRILRKPRV